jgi:uncharacterized protein (DUF58 family)
MKFIDSLKARLFKPTKPSNQPITLTHHRIFILPTQRGLAFVGLIALLLLIAFIYNNNLVYMLAFLLFGIFFITILHSFKSMNALTLRQGKTDSVFAGENAQFILYVENQTTTPRYSLNFKTDNSLPQQIDISPNSTKQVILTTKTQRRGWHELGIITLSCEFPLGLFRTWSLLNFDLKALVYPTPANIEIPFPENANSASQAGFAKPKTGDDDFYGLKPYQAGDSIKQIHWKTYAKGLGLFSKQYSNNVSADIWLDYEQTYAQNSETRLSQLCRWVVDAEKLGITYGFKLGELTLQPNNGESHAKKCLDALALF